MREYFFNKAGKLSSRKLTISHIEQLPFVDKIYEKTGYLGNVDLPTRVKYYIFCDSKPECPTCGTLLSFKGSNLQKYCSKKCDVDWKESLKKRDYQIANEKRKNTLVEKYGFEYNSQRPEVKEKLGKDQISSVVKSKLSDRDWLEEEYIVKTRSSVDIAAELGVFYATVLYWCRQHGFEIRQRSNYSLQEKEIADYITSLGFEVSLGRRDIIDPYEIDVYVEEKSLGVEYNGLYWHAKKNENYHKMKTDMFKGVLLHVFEDEWMNKKNIWKSVIASKLGVYSERIQARKCKVVGVGSKEARSFMERNHLQGFVGGTHLGLEYNGHLVSMVSYGKSRFKKELELLRFATSLHTQVIGGFGKLISRVPKPMITFADKRYSDGVTYSRFGQFMYETSPGYYWTDGNSRINRLKTQKHKLSGFLKNFDPEKTETENMEMNGYQKIYDCGQLKFMLS